MDGIEWVIGIGVPLAIGILAVIRDRGQYTEAQLAAMRGDYAAQLEREEEDRGMVDAAAGLGAYDCYGSGGLNEG